MSSDPFGLPPTILGPLPDEFFGAVGRIVCVCAVLEQQVSTLRHTLARAEQGAFTHQPVSKQIQEARSLATVLAADHRNRVHEFLAAAEQAFEERNSVVHSAFPAQDSGRLMGHRPVRDRSVTDGSAQWTVTSVDGLKRLIGRLSRLVLDFNQVFALAQSPMA